MRHRFVVALIAAAGIAAASDARGQWLTDKTPGIPRTADGKPNLAAAAPKTREGRPDLSGIWRADPGGYSFNLVLDLKPTEVLPWADALYKERSAQFSKDYPGYRCMPDIGPFYSFGMFKIIQSPGTTAVLSETGLFRQILTDGRALPIDPNPTWMGYSIGRWDGDTFVVTSAGFNDQSWLDFGGHPHTAALRVTERYRRRDFGHMHIEMTFEDVKAYTRPWTIAYDAELAADTELLEYVCNENEKSLSHFIVTEDDRRKSRVAASLGPEVLAKYEGRYDLTDLQGRTETYAVALSGGQLVVVPPSGGKMAMQPESETVFSVLGARLEFFTDATGTPTHFILSIVEGDMKAVRKP